MWRLYNRGVLPIIGPFVAALLVPVILLLRTLWLRRRLGRLSRRLAEELRSLSAMVADERSSGPQARPTGASDASLDKATVTLASALRHILDGRQPSGAEHARDSCPSPSTGARTHH